MCVRTYGPQTSRRRCENRHGDSRIRTNSAIGTRLRFRGPQESKYLFHARHLLQEFLLEFAEVAKVGAEFGEALLSDPALGEMLTEISGFLREDPRLYEQLDCLLDEIERNPGVDQR